MITDAARWSDLQVHHTRTDIQPKHEKNTLRHNQPRHALMVGRHGLTVVAILILG